MTDKELKCSDTTLLNFLQNQRLSVRYVGNRWVATTEENMGMGTNIRSALIDLRRKMYE